MKKTQITLLSLALVVALGTLLTHGFIKKSLPPMQGEIKLPILESPVTIKRDSYGIPHIEAANRLDSLRALGFVMASERLFQFEVSRRLTQGRLSEVFGEKMLEIDKLYRSLQLRKSTERMIQHEKSLNSFDEKLWQEMEAFFEGVNYYATHFPLPYELSLLNITPEKFTPLDAYIMTGHMAFSFGIAMTADPLMSQLANDLKPEKFQALRNDVPSKSKITTRPQSPSAELFTAKVQEILPHSLGFFEGSNAWLIHPKRSSTGSSIFANDPHISYGLPAVWFEAHLKSPELEIYGHFLPLIPFPVLGHDSGKAWGFTMSLADDMDLYVETIDREKKTVLFKKQEVPLTEVTETIKIKNRPDFSIKVLETPHGPVLDNVLKQDYALKWSFHRPENNTMKALQKMGEATTLEAFEKAMQWATAPGLNVLYADKENIAWWIFGDIALKNNPNSDMLLNGASGEDEYVRYLSWNEKPHLVNPPEGIIVSANARPQGLRTDIRGEWQSSDRYDTIRAKLQSQTLWDVEATKKLQVANLNSKNVEILRQLLKGLSAETRSQHSQVVDDLEGWNHESSVDLKAPTYYHLWLNEISLELLAELPSAHRDAYLQTSYAWVFVERTILDDSSPWWEGRSPSGVFDTTFLRMLEHPDAHKPWGSVHTIEYVHPLGRIKPLDKIFNLGPYPIPGAYNDINNQKMSTLGRDFKVVAGPSTRRVIDMGNTDVSWGINPIGNSGHRLSPHFKNQISLFIEGKHRPQFLGTEAVDKNTTHTLILKTGPK